MEHELKTWPQYYCRVADGSKTFEIRNNDRGFQPRDTVKLFYFDPTINYDDDWGYKDRHKEKHPPLEFIVRYVFPIDAERVVFSLLPNNNTP